MTALAIIDGRPVPIVSWAGPEALVIVDGHPMSTAAIPDCRLVDTATYEAERQQADDQRRAEAVKRRETEAVETAKARRDESRATTLARLEAKVAAKNARLVAQMENALARDGQRQRDEAADDASALQRAKHAAHVDVGMLTRDLRWDRQRATAALRRLELTGKLQRSGHRNGLDLFSLAVGE